MLIAVEGCVGVGKSTVVGGLAKLRGSATLFENFELNPFLADFYDDPVAHALETEFAFLLIHYHQLKRCLSIKTSEVISDFTIAKDLVYADLNLHVPNVRAVFQGLYDLFQRDLPTPDLTICLEASDALVLERIRGRNRPFEQRVDPNYYVQLNSAFEAFFANQKGRKLRVNMDECDFVADSTLFSSLSGQIDKTLQD